MGGEATDSDDISRAEYLGDAWLDEDARAAFETESAEGPGLFLAAAGTALVFLTFVLVVAWYLTAPRFGQLWEPLPWVLAGAAVGVVLYLALEYAGVILTVSTGKPILLPLAWQGRLALRFTPIATRMAKPLGKTVDRMVHSFVRVNNAVVESLTGKVAGPVLVLLPRCIQWAECEQPIIEDAEYCKRCGKCPMAELMDIRAGFENVEYYVLTGGRVAADVIKKVRPAAVIGVACERELLAGIELVDEIPVVGIANVRPEGPCLHTQVFIEDFEETLEHFATRKRSG
ncbi:MAG: DUF116 domain-containing protein [Candidatus Coatesbacteria bacterium]|nr:MAG: DUF116 domain-containing protein [Candidatus Coatesbacteria bacterium]